MSKRIIYTIGYTIFQKGSEIQTDQLFETLKQFNITHLVDVRSVPYSKQYPQCNSNNLTLLGKKYGIPYIHMPEIGAKADNTQDVFSKASDVFFDDIFPITKSNRPEKQDLTSEEYIVDFRKFRNEERFIEGLKRIENAYEKGFTLALMCSEKRALDCHRYFLISRAIEQRFGDCIEVKHIIKDANNLLSIVSNKELDQQLSEIILNKSEIKELNILNSSILGPARIENYLGKSLQEKINDFCDRYWNLMHGWKKNINNNNSEDYD